MGGASMVKYIAWVSYIGLSESDSKLYNNSKLCEGIIQKNFFKYIDLQNQAIY